MRLKLKPKILIGALLCMCLSIGIRGTSAYFTFEDTASNVITAGNIRIALREMSVPEEGGEAVPFANQTGVLPGSEISKIVTVQNVGDQRAYVRIFLQKTVTLADGAAGEADLSLIGCDFNTENWTEQDGYYYYNLPLDPGEETEALFTKVTFAREMGNMYQGSTAEIKVTAQATQAANNGTDVFSASSWPAASDPEAGTLRKASDERPAEAVQ